jgi:aspartate/methionine/tyrosine aminotransferase
LPVIAPDIAPNISELRHEGAFEVLDRAAALAAEGRDIINLGIGQPDFKTAPHIVEAAVRALEDGHHGYTPPAGIPQLREAVGTDLAERLGVTVDPGQVVIVPGGKVTMQMAILMFGRPGVEIVYPDPGFPVYASLIDYSGATGVPLPLLEQDGFAFSAEALLERITPRCRLIVLNSPANPTGGITPKAEVDKLAAGLEDHPQVAVLSDEIYGRLIYDGQRHASLLAYPHLRDRVVLLDGWSKTYAMTGWRLGYGVWPAGLVDAAIRMAVNSYSCVNAAAQYAGIAALTGPQGPVDDMVSAFDARRRLAVEGLNGIPGLSCVMPGGAFYAFPNIAATGRSAKELEQALLERAGVATIAGTSFGAHGEGYLRVSYANSRANIEEAMARIRDCLEGL